MRIKHMHSSIAAARLEGMRRHEIAKARLARAEQAKAKLEAKAKAEAKKTGKKVVKQSKNKGY